MASIIIRTLIIYILLSFTLKVMGKRQIGELEIGELVTTLLISELASIPIDDPDIPLLNAILPIILLFSFEIIISTVKNKSDKMKRLIEGEPVYIIYKGKLLQSALEENRLSINELLSELRIQGIGDISTVKYAILEQSGKLAVIKEGEDSYTHALILDTAIQKENLKKLGYEEIWLNGRLEERGLRAEEVFLLTVSDGGKIYVVKKEKK